MRGNLDSLDVEAIAKINRERQAEMQRVARQEWELRTANLLPSASGRFVWLKTGLDTLGHGLRVAAEHLAAGLHHPKPHRPAIRHR